MSLAQRKRAVALLELQSPGAGMAPDEIVPFETVTRDGFFEVGCFKDYLYEHGDKFGNNKFAYEYGELGNVSIVHYKEIVPKEDQEKMSHEVCFRFCRTVPDMYYFGVNNGRDCYCEPYFKRMAGDSSDCDAACEGDPGSLCGSSSKSIVFEMHWCGGAADKLTDTADYGLVTERFMRTSAEDMREGVAAKLQNAASHLQNMFGQVGDSAASQLMQKAKIFAGKLEDFVQDAQEFKDPLLNGVTKAQAFNEDDLSDSDKLTEAEEVMKEIKEDSKKTRALLEKANKLYALTQRGKDEADLRAGRQYTSFMGFLDKEHGHDMSTCTGDVAPGPIFETSPDGCAAACDDDRKCVGFSYYDVDNAGSICFLVHKFKSVTHYTKCKSKGFLQLSRHPHLDAGTSRFDVIMSRMKAQQDARVSAHKSARKAEVVLDRVPAVIARGLLAHAVISREATRAGKGCRCDEELYLGLCYKKCALLTEGKFTMRSGANTCCRNEPCVVAGSSKTDGFGCDGYGVSGDGDCAGVPATKRKGSGTCDRKAPDQVAPPELKLQSGGKDTGMPSAAQMVAEALKQDALDGVIGAGVDDGESIEGSGPGLVMCFGKFSEFSGTKPKVEVTKAKRCYKK